MAARTAIVVLAVLVLPPVLVTNRAEATSYVPARVLAEIDEIHNALQEYKEKYRVYPPCMGDVDADARKLHFMRHLRRAYPNSAHGVRAADFDTLNSYVATNYKVPGPNGTISLDLNRLDEAEALVFWLGGFPTPAATGAGGSRSIAPSRLFGFNRDAAIPMNRSYEMEADDPLVPRTFPLLFFHEERLADNDGDGWWEYSPIWAWTGDAAAPFVYFDSATYRRSSDSKRPGTVAYPKDPKLTAIFGTAVPFAEAYDPADPSSLKWRNPESYQIVCAGWDGKYSSPSAGPRVEIYPLAASLSGVEASSCPGVTLDDEERDNLTNLGRTMLSGEMFVGDGSGTFDFPDYFLRGVFGLILIALWFGHVMVNRRALQAKRSREASHERLTNSSP
jgi:hypothetical protein